MSLQYRESVESRAIVIRTVIFVAFLALSVYNMIINCENYYAHIMNTVQSHIFSSMKTTLFASDFVALLLPTVVTPVVP